MEYLGTNKDEVKHNSCIIYISVYIYDAGVYNAADFTDYIRTNGHEIIS